MHILTIQQAIYNVWSTTTPNGNINFAKESISFRGGHAKTTEKWAAAIQVQIGNQTLK